jgi:hypothetical protein
VEKAVMKDFTKGLIAGMVMMGFLVVGVGLLVFAHYRDKKIIEAWEVQHEFEQMESDIRSRDADEFLDEFPGVRPAADSGRAEFDRKRDAAVERIRGGRID